MRRTVWASTRSAPVIRQRRLANASGRSATTCSTTAIGANMTSTPAARSVSCRRAASSWSSRRMPTSRAPFRSAFQISSVDASNEWLQACATVSAGRTARNPLSRLRVTTLRCVIPTPFGRPVEPDV